MITMRIEVNITEDMDTLYARQQMAARVYSVLTELKWTQKVRVIHEHREWISNGNAEKLCSRDKRDINRVLCYNRQ